jgi:hypothetical protein
MLRSLSNDTVHSNIEKGRVISGSSRESRGFTDPLAFPPYLVLASDAGLHATPPLRKQWSRTFIVWSNVGLVA